MKNMKQIALVGIVALVMAGSASAALYEGFDYTTGTAVNGNITSPGFTGAWTQETLPAGTTIYADSLTYTDSKGNQLQTSGGKIGGNGGAGRGSYATLDSNNNSGDRWGSVLLQMNGSTSSDANTANLTLYNTSYTDQAIYMAHRRGGVRFNAGSNTNTIGGAPSGTTQFLVWHVDINSGSDDVVTFWVNPDLDSTPSFSAYDAVTNTNGYRVQTTATGTGESSWNYEGVRLTFNDNTSVDDFADELRIGTSFADVSAYTAVPEPATMSLLALGGVAMLRRRKK